MSMPRPDKKQGEFTGKHMLIFMCLFFGVIIAVNITMATLASGTWTGLVVKNSYVASQQYNAELMKARDMRKAGIHSEIKYDNSTLTLTFKNREGNIPTAINLAAEIGRPAFESEDRMLPFVSCAEDCHELKVDLEAGSWLVKITGQLDGKFYRRDARLHVDGNGVGRVP
ncbi:MAG: FixH family protein [Roseovarius sp.]|nr:FixH family protein [Roseovarius sp.]MCY4207700.1 FixH family protein [Roseovarius sp.]MCY4316896.1 FixH family protein [Roseovarius sp.]